jgi:hypothetical protein
MDDKTAEYLLHLSLAQGAVLDAMFELLLRHRRDLAKDLLLDIDLLGQRAKPELARFLQRTAEGWWELYEAPAEPADGNAPDAPIGG